MCAAAVDYARDHGLVISVRGGAHNVAGTALADDGMTIDMSRLRGVHVDPLARTATVQPGCLLGDVDRETQLHGLATPLGFYSEVGVAGLTLGGGLGYLTRRFGWTVDNLLEVEIVTADGAVRRASRDRELEPVLGRARCRRQLRRRDLVYLPPARGRTDGVWRPDRVALCPRRRDSAGLPSGDGVGAARARRVDDPPARTGRPVRPGGVARASSSAR